MSPAQRSLTSLVGVSEICGVFSICTFLNPAEAQDFKDVTASSCEWEDVKRAFAIIEEAINADNGIERGTLYIPAGTCNWTGQGPMVNELSKPGKGNISIIGAGMDKTIITGLHFKLNEDFLKKLGKDVPTTIVDKLQLLLDQTFIEENDFLADVEKKIGSADTAAYKELILKYARSRSAKWIIQHREYNTEPIRISGMTLDYCKNGVYMIEAENWRIDHMNFEGTGLRGFLALRAYPGLVDHCKFLNGTQRNSGNSVVYGKGEKRGRPNITAFSTKEEIEAIEEEERNECLPWPERDFGTENAVFVEDNFFENFKQPVSQYDGGHTVFRYNTVYGSTGDALDTHGPYGWRACLNSGRTEEVYENKFFDQRSNLEEVNFTMKNPVSARGGAGIVFDNYFDSPIGVALVMENSYRRYRHTEATLKALESQIPSEILTKLQPLTEITDYVFKSDLEAQIKELMGETAYKTYGTILLKPQHADTTGCEECTGTDDKKHQQPSGWWVWGNTGSDKLTPERLVEPTCWGGCGEAVAQSCIKEGEDYFERAPTIADDGFTYTPYPHPHPLTESFPEPNPPTPMPPLPPYVLKTGWNTPFEVKKASNLKSAKKLIDKNTSTGFAPWDGNDGHWVILDMSKSARIEKLNFFYNKYASIKPVAAIYVSEDGDNWGESLGMYPQNGNWPAVTGWYEIDITDTQTRYIKLEADKDVKNPSWLELEVYVEVDSLNGTVYEDAEDGKTDGWDTYVSTVEGTISNVYVNNPKHKSNVIKLTGGTWKETGYRLRKDENGGLWNNTEQFVIEWKHKYANENHYFVYIVVDTTDGPMYLFYTALDRDLLSIGNGRIVHHGLGAETKKGAWVTIRRDLQADLDDVPGSTAKITAVNEFLIRGSGMVDDICLLDSMGDFVNPSARPVSRESRDALADDVQWLQEAEFGLDIMESGLDQPNDKPGQIDPSSGKETRSPIDPDPSAVPEPGTLVLFGLGLVLGLAGLFRKIFRR